MKTFVSYGPIMYMIKNEDGPGWFCFYHTGFVTD